MSQSKHLNTHELKIVQWNCFKMTADRLVELKLFLEEFDPDIVSIQELKLNQEQAHLYLSFDGYTVHYKPRKNNPTYGGGVVVIVRDSIANSVIVGLDDSKENVGIRVETKDICFNLVSLYSPAKTLNFEAIKKYSELGPELFLLGDLNSKTPVVGCNSLDENGKVLEHILSELELTVINDLTPTYYSHSNEKYSEILDIMLCTSQVANRISKFEVLTEEKMGSDHAPVMCTLRLEKSFKHDLTSNINRFNFTKADWNKYGHILDEMIGELDLGECSDIDNIHEHFSNLIIKAADSSIPKFAKTTQKSYPSHILELIKARRASRKNKKGKSLEVCRVLNTEYNRLTGLIKKSIKEYTERRWSNFLDKLGPYPASSGTFWRIINRARTQKKSSTIPTLIVDGRAYSTDEDKANLFADVLGETFTENGASTDFDSIIYSYVEDFVAKFDFSDDQFAKITFSELSEILKNLKVDSSPGEDGVQNRFLKNLSSRGMDLLLKLVNMSLIEGLPSAWKAAVITMIPKKDIKSTNHADYRPISLLSCVGKVAERVVKNRLYAFLENNKLIIQEQSGFRNKRGTSDNLLFMTQKIQECLNRYKKVCGIFFDISKAFDKVWHAGLIYKLIYLGVPVYIIRFIRNFLSDRFFKVKVNDTFSRSHPITCSVPQGSVLGPLLFLVFIGDIPLSNSKSVSYSALFADDLSSIFFFNKPGKIIHLMKAYLASLVEWLFKWRLKMNASKCCYTIFSKGGRGNLVLDLRLNGESIPYNPNPIFLGITFDERLTFNVHFENLRVRALKRLNIIKIFSHKSWHLNRATLTNIYRALIGSIFDYSFFSIACVSETKLNRVQTVQNRAIRCIYRLKWDSPSGSLFQISGLLPLKVRFLQLGARYLAKVIRYKNEFVTTLIAEYIRSWSAITANDQRMSTPLCFFTSMLAVSFACLVVIIMSAFCLVFFF